MRELRTFALAVLTAGILDLISAFVFAGLKGIDPFAVMRGVASGPFGDRLTEGGFPAVLLGFCVHFALMSNFVAVFMVATKQFPALLRQPVVTGLLYGTLLYLVMYWGVLAIRYPTIFPQTDPVKIAKAMFSHLICVGVPMAFIVARGLRV